MAKCTHHFAWDVEYSTHALDVLPVLLPLTAHICARFVSGIPIPHKDGREVIILLIILSKSVRRILQDLRTFSASNFAVTDESTPPDIATTTVRTINVRLRY